MSGYTASPTAKPKKSLLWIALHKLGTPLTAGLFLVSTISGVALFFRWGSGLFHSMHEWLSMALLLPFMLHMGKNWRPIVGYAKRKTGVTLFILCMIAAIPFMLPKKDGRSGNPAFRIVGLVRQAPLTDAAAIFKTTPEQLLARLQKAGYRATDTTQSIDDIAAASQVPPTEVIAKLMSPPTARNHDTDSRKFPSPEQSTREKRS